MDQIDQLEREIREREQDEATRRMAHGIWVYFAALLAEGFTAADALEITLSWQMLVMTRGEG
jgi:hypothetical protein